MNMSTFIEVVHSLTEDQIAVLKELEQDAFGTHGAADEWVLVPLARYGCIVLFREEKDPRPVGVCELVRNYYQPDQAYIYGFFIRSDKKGCGYGTAFLNQLVIRLKEDGFNSVCLTVSPENKGAVALYEKAGFRTAELRIDEYGKGHDRYYMEMSL